MVFAVRTWCTHRFEAKVLANYRAWNYAVYAIILVAVHPYLHVQTINSWDNFRSSAPAFFGDKQRGISMR